MLADAGKSFKKAIREHSTRRMHTDRLTAKLWPADNLEIVPASDMSVSSFAMHACSLQSRPESPECLRIQADYCCVYAEEEATWSTEEEPTD